MQGGGALFDVDVHDDGGVLSVGAARRLGSQPSSMRRMNAS